MDFWDLGPDFFDYEALDPPSLEGMKPILSGG